MNSLSDIFDGWGGYQLSLVHALEPRSAEELAWRPSGRVRAMGELARHISMGRVNWFVRMGAPRSAELAGRIGAWIQDADGNRYIDEQAIAIAQDPAQLAEWLTASWEMIDATLRAWTTADLPQTYRHMFRGKPYNVSRQWTIWRIMAHDIHHGGQIARILAEQGIEAFELRALGGHTVAPPLAR